MPPSRDHLLPPDPDAYRRAPHPRGRIIVIAPTRAACETIELALSLHLDTVLEREHGTEVREWAAAGQAFGIVAGTGVGKTLGIRPIAEAILREPLRVGVEAKDLVSGILFSPSELSEDAERELERAGRSISVVCGDQLVATLIAAGVGVVSSAAPMHYLDDQLLEELLAG